MKLFGRSGGYYIFWTGFVYLWVGLLNIYYKFCPTELIQMLWIVSLILPLTVKPVARYFNMKLFWEE
jgi:hypothetical protein